MTTTIPTQARAAHQEIQILRTPPTLADAQLILQHQLVDAVSGAHAGYAALAGFEAPPTLGQLRKRHPAGSTEYGQVMAFLSSCETMATFVRQGLLSEALVLDLYAMSGAWRMAERAVKGMRREYGEPRLYEHFEWLAGRDAAS